MQETRQFLYKFAVVSVYFSENINNSTIFLEVFKFDFLCVRTSYMKLKKVTHLMQHFIYYYK